jgi:hypothetical protein
VTCQNGGTCSTLTDASGVTCSCVDGWTDPRCNETKITKAENNIPRALADTVSTGEV